jgi:hypothetical protein
MSSSDIFVNEFERLLERIPKDTSFRQLQYNYRQFAFLMGMKILQNFPEVLIGPAPPPPGDEPSGAENLAGGNIPIRNPPRGGGNAGGPTIGPYPHELCKIVCAILDT